MGILAWIVVGLIAGVVAKAVMPGGGPGGISDDLSHYRGGCVGLRLGRRLHPRRRA